MLTIMDKTSSDAITSRFSDFSPLLEKWAFPAENQRSAVRWGASASEFEEFYSKMMPRLGEFLELLSHNPPNKLPPELHGIYQLVCAFAEAAPHHELYKGSAEVPHSFDPRRFRALHGNDPS
jgi:hypothetical protein